MTTQHTEQSEREEFEAWFKAHSKKANLERCGESYFGDWAACAWEGWKARAALLSATPAREWVGLTDEEVFNDDGIMEVNADAGLDMARIMKLVRAVESKLREKNRDAYDDEAYREGFRAGRAAEREKNAALLAEDKAGGEPVAVCDGKEQDAFEAWAKSEGYDMGLHPLHWLFLNQRTYAARQGWKAAIRYASTHPQPQAERVPEGYALVPVEPTDAMVQAAHHIDLSYMPGQEGADRAAIYRAMLAAAPKPHDSKETGE